MPKRSNLGLTGYRFGFNGKESDNDVKGLGNQQDYGMRIYDPRLGRFLSIDPWSGAFSHLTPYQFSSNSPIANIDLDGGEAKYFNILVVKTFDGQGHLLKEEASDIEDKSREAGWFATGSFIYRAEGELGGGTLFTFREVRNTVDEFNNLTSRTVIDKGALYIPSDEDEASVRGRGGLYFVSSSGGSGGKSGSLSGDDAIPINIDLLVSAVGGFPKGNADTEMSPFQYSGDEIEKLKKLASILKSDKNFAVKMDKLLGGIKALLGAEKAGEKAGHGAEGLIKSVESLLNEKKRMENDKLNAEGAEFLQCISCHEYRKTGTKGVMPATKKDTANKGITPKNTKRLSLEQYHSY